jgi:hypothetical protein
MFEPLALVLHVVIGATLMGVGITAALVAGVVSGLALLGAALAGLVVALPLSVAIARAIAPRC